MAAVACFCGTSFSSVDILHQHASSQGHRFVCGCGSLFKELKHLLDHQAVTKKHVATNYTELPALKGYDPKAKSKSTQTALKCVFCPSKKAFSCDVALKAHLADKHPTCPTCQQAFHDLPKGGLTAAQKLKSHQKATGHCYCDEHSLAFKSTDELATHNRAAGHVTGFECIDCERAFKTSQGLEDHLEACLGQRKKAITDDKQAKAAFSAAEEANLRCEACNKSFKALTAFKQHKKSLKHNPISDLACPLSKTCTQKIRVSIRLASSC